MRLACSFFWAILAAVPLSAADVATAQFDAARTMANPSETYLTTANVNGSHGAEVVIHAVERLPVFGCEPTRQRKRVAAGDQLDEALAKIGVEDGTVNLIDLATVARHVPQGQSCP